jgi:hypothetical protein
MVSVVPKRRCYFNHGGFPGRSIASFDGLD